MNWQDKVRQMRRLPEAMRIRLMWEQVPRSVAQSMAFEGEPVEMRLLEEQHRRRKPPDLIGSTLGIPHCAFVLVASSRLSPADADDGDSGVSTNVNL